MLLLSLGFKELFWLRHFYVARGLFQPPSPIWEARESYQRKEVAVLLAFGRSWMLPQASVLHLLFCRKWQRAGWETSFWARASITVFLGSVHVWTGVRCKSGEHSYDQLQFLEMHFLLMPITQYLKPPLSNWSRLCINPNQVMELSLDTQGTSGGIVHANIPLSLKAHGITKSGWQE